MLVSWEWLSDYVQLTVDHEEMATRWALTGLNHESTEMVEGVPVIDLEITSNRGDCLGHIGVAREASVLLSQTLKIPSPVLQESTTSVSSALTIENQFREGCPRYIGRVIRGVKIGPSPEWLRKRLEAIGVKSINNVVDATNYVMFECGQPLHAFDMSKIRGNKIVIRPATAKENFVAIDHKTYQLDPTMVVIADESHAVALAGVMGGVDSEVGNNTVDVLLEAAEFAPLCIRRTARKLKLHSPSSYRYERRVDSAQLDWASRRCAELILKLAGGELLKGAVDTGKVETAPLSITLRAARISNVLGIDVPWSISLDILQRLGCQVRAGSSESEAVVCPPTYRMDLVREIDLIEEIARIYGYDKIPEDAVVPMVASARRPKDIMMQTVRNVCCGCGYHETMTPSLVGKSPSLAVSPWSELEPMSTLVPLLEGASLLRRSLIPSLLASRLHNQQQSNRDVRLFETSNVYLASVSGKPVEQLNLGLLGTCDIREVIGTFEEVLERVCGREFAIQKVTMQTVAWPYLEASTGIEWLTDGERIAWVGQIGRPIADSMKLDALVAVGELNLDLLLRFARTVPQLKSIIPFPVVDRDLNLIVDEQLSWQILSTAIKQSAGPLCIGVAFKEIYRDTKKDGEGKKRVLLSLQLQSETETLTSKQADDAIQSVLSTCKEQFNASILL
ncbi:MAG: phenylalanine--tRNA ligase subunit beta [Planctomycetota bacterium]|nr:phenylalanine--tRNA ligase subunit beta [Planctomycetota bacterium]